MHHWNPNGWIPVLGADWSYSWWEDRCGLDFLLETQARAIGEDSYFDSVCCLEMIGRAVMGEPALDSMVVLPSPGSFWCSLALMAKHILAGKSQAMRTVATSPLKSTMSVGCGENEPIRNIISQKLQAKETEETVAIETDDGKIIIPATSCSEPRQSTAHVQFTPSFLGGSQLHHTEGDAFEYTIADLPDDRAGEYALSLRLCNVHLKQQPLLLTVSGGGSAASNDAGVMTEDGDVVDVLSIVVPYTVGEWQWTDPVTIHLSPGTNVLSFSRETPNWGLSIKDITCTPIESV